MKSSALGLGITFLLLAGVACSNASDTGSPGTVGSTAGAPPSGGTGNGGSVSGGTSSGAAGTATAGSSSGGGGAGASAAGAAGVGPGGTAGGGAAGSSGSAGMAVGGNASCKADLGYALQFHGTGDDRVHADITKLPVNQEARTIELWAYFDGTALSWHNEHGLFEYGQKGGCHEFAINTVDWNGAGPGEIHPYGNCDEIDNFFNMPAEVMKTGWVHISYSYDAAAKQFHFTINGSDQIQNGAPANRAHPIGNWPGNTFSTMKSPLRIGTTDDFQGPPGWQGKIDELRVWNVYRTPQQIKDNMTVILKGNEPGLVAYYHFDEGSGTSSADTTGDANNAAKFVGTEMATWPMWVKSDIAGTWTGAP